MKSLVLKTTVQVVTNIEDLSKSDRRLLQAAQAAIEDAYAPYSKFRVGAAVFLSNEKILPGSNQENASYPLCLCAERVALAAADSRYPRVAIKAIAITARNPRRPLTRPVAPCGACRQVLLESEHKHGESIRIILYGDSGAIYILNSAKDLLPLSFDASFL